ncbi:glutathione S-transferase U25-like [Sesamum indicum]|uniref:Glutathione S-transferase U25-like n=1 Tax=Sesamum indicum TaxID=4182 RepID=A0A6I9TJS1_SESIN|nr:glutathione S-transferase U25-like [Sesamum indicum]
MASNVMSRGGNGVGPRQVYGAGGKITWHRYKHEAAEGKKELIENLKVLEGVLGDKPYSGGETFGYLDIALLEFYMWFPAYETFGSFIIEAECPKLIAWGRRCSQRESVSKCLVEPNKMVDLVVCFRRMFGLK